MAQPCDHNCPARIKFEYDKFQDKQVEIKIDKSEKNGLKMRIRIKDEYSLNGIEIEMSSRRSLLIKDLSLTLIMLKVWKFSIKFNSFT